MKENSDNERLDAGVDGKKKRKRKTAPKVSSSTLERLGPWGFYFVWYVFLVLHFKFEARRLCLLQLVASAHRRRRRKNQTEFIETGTDECHAFPFSYCPVGTK